MLPDSVASLIASRLGTRIDGARSLGGGCIAHASRLVTPNGPLFAKWSMESVAFPSEAQGLRALREAEADLIVPEPLLALAAAPPVPGVLVLEWIQPGTPGRGFWEAFGRGLAMLHRHTSGEFGFDGDNYIGRLPQHNQRRSSWPEFFAAMRLEPQVRMARRAGRWQREWTAPLDRLMNELEALLPERPDASIVHGDLWNGNFLPTEAGGIALIDPAVYYGHREVDLAMTELFGGFDERFYAAYRTAWPVEDGYEQRRQVYNLYHLINHLNHFGGGYANAVARTLSAF